MSKNDVDQRIGDKPILLQHNVQDKSRIVFTNQLNLFSYYDTDTVHECDRQTPVHNIAALARSEFHRGYVFISVCQFVCLFVSRIVLKFTSDFNNTL